jgi:hypothetical protein
VEYSWMDLYQGGSSSSNELGLDMVGKETSLFLRVSQEVWLWNRAKNLWEGFEGVRVVSGPLVEVFDIIDQKR